MSLEACSMNVISITREFGAGGAELARLLAALVAPQAWRVERMARLEGEAPEVALAQCIKVDRTRRHFNRYFFGEAAGESSQYDLVVNTGRVPLEDVVPAIVAVVTVASNRAAAAKRVLTLSREFGAGDQGFAPSLADRLGLRIYDRKMLERQSVRLGVPESELEKIDEQPAGMFQQLHPGSLYQKYFKALEQLTHELADGGEVLLVGRGGCWFLRDRPNAFHVHLTATMATRVRRVMEYRWVRDEVARKLIAHSDAQRRSFCYNYFGADWTDPLEYHLTANSGRLGPLAVETVAQAAERHWNGWVAARS
jgi:cytidylate kinase